MLSLHARAAADDDMFLETKLYAPSLHCSSVSRIIKQDLEATWLQLVPKDS